MTEDSINLMPRGYTDKEKKEQWQAYTRCCKNREDFERALGRKIKNQESLIKILEDNIINYDLPRQADFRLICLNGKDWAPIDEAISSLIPELNRRGYITRFCCSGHMERARRMSDNTVLRVYNPTFYISFDKMFQTKRDLDTAFELLFSRAVGKESMTAEDYEKSGWNNIEIPSRIEILRDHETYMKQCMEAIQTEAAIKSGAIKFGDYSKPYPLEMTPYTQCPEPIKAVVLEKYGETFIFWAEVREYDEIKYINEFLLNVLV